MTISSLMNLTVILSVLIAVVIFIKLAAIQNKFEYSYTDTILQLAVPVSMLIIIVLSISFFLHDYLTIWNSFIGLSWVLIIAIISLIIILVDLVFAQYTSDFDLADNRLSYGVIAVWSATAICLVMTIICVPVSHQSVKYSSIRDIQTVKNTDVRSYVKSPNGDIKILTKNPSDLFENARYQNVGKVKIIEKTCYVLPKSLPEQTRINYQSVKIKKRFAKTYQFLESRHLLSDDAESVLSQKKTKLKITRLKHVRGTVHHATNPGSY